MFQDLIETLQAKGKSIHAYRQFAEKALAGARANPDRAAAYFLLATAADTFVQRNERMPISVNDLDTVFETFKAHLDLLEGAYRSGTPDDLLAALNAIALSAA